VRGLRAVLAGGDPLGVVVRIVLVHVLQHPLPS
jgi:hypothetical protein